MNRRPNAVDRRLFEGRPPIRFLAFVLLLISAHSAWALLGRPRPPTCDHFVQVAGENSTETAEKYETTINREDFEYVDRSATCAEAIGSDWERFRQCEEHEFSLDLYTHSILPGKATWPYIRLNMSATMHEPASSVWFVYRCLQASNQEDTYCTNPPVPSPCRGMKLNATVDETIPFRADITCFKLFGYSHYRLDTIIKPQDCVATTFLTMPHENLYDPSIHHYLNGGGIRGGTTGSPPAPLDFGRWSPFVFVETHPVDGVWVRFEEPPHESGILEVRLALYCQSTEIDSASFVREEVIRLPQTGFKWTELDAGKYSIFAYVQLSHCRLSCSRAEKANEEGEGSVERKCVACPHTSLNFTLPNDKHSAAWKRREKLANIGFVSFIVLIVLLGIIGVALFGVLIFQQHIRPWLISRRPPQNFELRAQPRVLLIYTDDCTAHSDCCLQLAFFLARNASARVHIDQLDLIDPSVQATNWLLNRMMNVDFVILVFSDGSKRVMEGERMGEQRPFPDLFNAATRLVVSMITNILNSTPALAQASNDGRPQRNGHSMLSALLPGSSNGHFPSSTRNFAAEEALRKFVMLRFNYSASDAVAEFFPLVGCRCYEVPSELPRIVGHLHGIDVHESSVLDHTDEHLQLDQAMRACVRYRQSNPNYLAERFKSGSTTTSGLNPLTGVQLANPELPERHGRTEEEMEDLIKRYDLIQPPPDEEDEREANGRLRFDRHSMYSNADTGVIVESNVDEALRDAARGNLLPHRMAEEYPLVEVSSCSSDSDAGG